MDVHFWNYPVERTCNRVQMRAVRKFIFEAAEEIDAQRTGSIAR